MAKKTTGGDNIIDLMGLLDAEAMTADGSRLSARPEPTQPDTFRQPAPLRVASGGQSRRPMILIGAWAVFVIAITTLNGGSHPGQVEFWLSADSVSLLTQIIVPALLVLYLRPLRQQMQKLEARGEEMRSSINRIADPEPDVSGKIVSIRHAVRQELAKLNDQLDESLNRTGEIEAAVKREVGVLESSFADNERRMLGLVQELARQRETLVAATDQVQSVVRGSRETMHDELANLASQVLEAGNYARGVVEEVNLELRSELANQGTKFATTIRDVIDERVRPLGNMLSEQVQSIDSLLKDGGGGLVETFGRQGQHLTGALDAARLRLREDLEGQTRDFNEVAERLSASISNSLDSSVNRLESQISTASIELAGVIDVGARHASQRFIDITSGTMNEFDGRLASLQKGAEVHIERFGGLLDTAAQRLLPTLDRHSSTLERALELEGALEETTERLNDLLTTKAGAFSESMARNVRDFHAKISDHSKEISDGLAQKMDRAVDVLDEGSRRFTSTLRNVQDTVAVASDKLSITVAAHNATVAQHVDQIETIFANGSERLDEQLVQSVGALSASLEKGASSVGKVFAENTLHISTMLGDSLGDADKAFQARYEQFKLAEIENQNRLQSTFDSSLRSVAELIGGGEDSLTNAAKQARLRMETTTESFGLALNEMWQKFSADLASFAERTREDMSQNGSQNVASLEAKTLAIAAAIQDKVSSIYSSLDARTREFEANISEFGSRIDAQTSRLHRVISQKTEIFEEGMEQGVGRLETNISGHLQRAAECLDQFLQAEGATFDRQFSDLSRVLGEQAESLAIQFGSSQSAIELRAAKLAATVAQFDATVEQQVNRLDKQLMERSVHLEQNLKAGIETINSALAGHIDRSETTRVDFLKDTQHSFDRQVEVLTRTLDSRSEVLDSIMRTRGADFTDQLHSSSKQFEEQLSETGRALELLFRSASSEIERAVSRQNDQMQLSLEGMIDKSSARVDQRISDIDARLSLASGRLSETLERRSDQLLGSLNAKTNLLDEALSAGASRLDTSLSRETVLLAERIRESGASVEAQMREQVAAAATALNEGSERIGKAVKNAAAEIDARVGEGVTGVTTSMDKSLLAVSQVLQAGVEQTQRQLDASVDTLLVRLSQHEKKALGRMESAAANVGDTTRKAAELAADRLVTVNGALVQVLSALGTTRPAGRKTKSEIPDAAE